MSWIHFGKLKNIFSVSVRAGASTTRVLVLPKMINMNILKTSYSSATPALMFQYSYSYVQYSPKPWFLRSIKNEMIDDTDCWNPSSWKIRICFSYKVDTMAAEDLVTQGTKPSATMLLISIVLLENESFGTRRVNIWSVTSLQKFNFFPCIPLIKVSSDCCCEDNKGRDSGGWAFGSLRNFALNWNHLRNIFL